MKKADKAIPEEILIEEAPDVIQELAAGAAAIPAIGKPRGIIQEVAEPAETLEQREERLMREDYQRRNLQAMVEYEKVLSRNGVPNPVHPSRQNPDAAVDQRCCH